MNNQPKENKEECQWENCSGGEYCEKHSLLSAPQTPDSMEDRLYFEVMEDYILTAELGHKAKDQVLHKKELREHYKKLTDFIKSELAQAESSGRREERQFILNILDGIDLADEEMSNKGGGTKAIRHALESRII